MSDVLDLFAEVLTLLAWILQKGPSTHGNQRKLEGKSCKQGRTKGWCLTMRCWESIRDDRLVDVNIVEIYTLSLVSTSLFAVENGEIWETPYGWCLCAGLFQGIDHTQEKCLSESFGPGIDTVLRKEYLGKLDSIPGVPINSPSVVFSVEGYGESKSISIH